MSVVDAPVAGEERPRGQLRRELRLFEALAISVGIMAPTAAMALNGVAPAGLVGRAVPLAFLFAAIAIALVSYAFVRLTRYFNHAGSAYALVGLTVGPRAGFFACWALLATYTAFLAANFAESGTAIGAIAFASVFGLLSFGGFEGAAALGEETNNPRRNVPLAIAVAVGFCGVFYTLVMLAQSLGFGIDKDGIEAFSSSSAPLADLSNSYVGSGMADAINFGAMMSAFASGLGCAVGASRLLFALGRDGFVTTRLGDTSRRTGRSTRSPSSWSSRLSWASPCGSTGRLPSTRSSTWGRLASSAC